MSPTQPHIEAKPPRRPANLRAGGSRLCSTCLTAGAGGFHGGGGLTAGSFQANSGHALGHIHQHGHDAYGGYGLYGGGYFGSAYCTPYWLNVDPELCYE